MTGRVICQLGWLQVQVHHEAIPINRTFGRAWAGEPSLINATAHQGHGNPVNRGWKHIYSTPLVFFVGAGLLHLAGRNVWAKQGRKNDEKEDGGEEKKTEIFEKDHF